MDVFIVIVSLFALWGAYLVLKKFWFAVFVIVLALVFLGGDNNSPQSVNEDLKDSDKQVSPVDSSADHDQTHQNPDLVASNPSLDASSPHDAEASLAHSSALPQMGSFRDNACMSYRHLLPAGTVIYNAWNASKHVKNTVEFEWLLWQRNIDPLTVQETGLVCAFNDAKFVIHEFILDSKRQAVVYEKTSD